jgi:hypothetical protein
MGKLCEVLAVEGELDSTCKAVLDEATKTFKDKAAHFVGQTKTYQPFDEGATEKEGTVEHLAMVTTVNEKLAYVFEHLVKLIDAKAQKDATNQVAKADIVVDGATLAAGIPATTLLGLEATLRQVKAVAMEVPTLPPGIEWASAPEIGKNVYKRVHPAVTFKTRKTFRSKILVEPTKEHPAQIEKWSEDENIGKFITEAWSGMLTPAEKSDMLGRIDTLARAVKEARQRANTTEVVKIKLAKSLMDYILPA